jgi:DNA-binding MarR family transcriptional regulator
MKRFTMYEKNMNPSTVPSLPRELGGAHELARDESGRLYSVGMRELFENLHVEMSAVEALGALKIAARMVSLVERVPDPEDRRSVRARLTEAGRARIEAIWKEGLEHQFEIVEGFNKDDLAQLRHLCLQLVENARKELGK